MDSSSWLTTLSGDKGKPEVTATIKIRYHDEETARAVWEAVSPDNFQTPQGIRIEADTTEGVVDILITCSRRLGSLIATIDDLLSCVQAAERALGGVLE